MSFMYHFSHASKYVRERCVVADVDRDHSYKIEHQKGVSTRELIVLHYSYGFRWRDDALHDLLELVEEKLDRVLRRKPLASFSQLPARSSPHNSPGDQGDGAREQNDNGSTADLDTVDNKVNKNGKRGAGEDSSDCREKRVRSDKDDKAQDGARGKQKFNLSRTSA